MTDTRPTLDISLIVPNYNNGAYLRAFLSSVASSTHWPRELLLVDDGSTDDSLDIIGEFAHLPFLKIIRLAQNKGLVHALNTALDAATGRYIMRADPDDVLMPDRMICQYDF